MLRILTNAGSAPAVASSGRQMSSRGSRRIHFDGMIRVANLWLERGRSRRALAALDDRQLRDVGLTRADLRLESEKPFWRP